MRSIFNYPYCISLLGLVIVLKTAHHISSVGIWSLVPEEAELTLFSKIVLLCSHLLGAYLEKCYKVLAFVLITWNQLRTEK